MFHKRLMKEFRESKKAVIGMVATQWVMLIANIILMFATASFISLMFTHSIDTKAITGLTVTFMLALIVRQVMSWWNSKISYEVSAKVKAQLRNMVFQKLMRLGSAYHETISTSEAVQISTEGVEQLEIYFGKYIPQFFYSLLAPLTLFVIVGTMSLKVALVLLLCVPLIPVSIIAVQKFAKKMLQKYWGTYTGLGDSFLECLQGLTTLKIYQADERYAKKMDEEAEKFRKVTMRVLIMQLNSISIMDLVAYGGAAAGILLSVLEFQKGNLSIAQCFFIIMISAEFFLPLRLLGSFFHIAMNGNAAADKIFRLMDAKEPHRGKVEELKTNDIVFEHVSFAYEEDKPVLDDISFRTAKYGLTALVGESGCGKSTIAALLMGEYLPGKGSLQIADTDSANINPETLQRKITRIRHDSYLFKGTVRDNLKMGNYKVTESEMLESLKKVNLYNFVMEQGGLDLMLSEKAANLSGGQKQRLALARALLHDSDIYIFDEATSNIDVESENQIMDVVYELSKEKLVLLISHRLANVVRADQIYVLKGGTIAEEGTHEVLLNKKGYYHTLFEGQRKLESYGKENENGR